MRTLEKAHPLTSLIYLVTVLLVTIFTRSPVVVGASLLGAAVLLLLCGRRRVLLWSVPAVLLCAVTNPLFSHSGETALLFIGDAAYTLEALVYGGIFGGMLAAVCGWSVLSVRFVTSDKYIWLFGRLLPVSGLVLSSTLRFLPLFLRRTADFTAARGSDTFSGRLSAFSASLGYSAEQAMDSADSMKARGYGSAKRTSYSIYRLGRRELSGLAVTVTAAVLCVIGLALGGGEFSCYPRISVVTVTAADVLLYSSFGLLSLLPSLAVLWESLRRARGYSQY